MRLKSLLVAAIAVTAFAAAANATPYTLSISENGVGSFDRVEAFAGTNADNIMLSSFSAAGWNATNNSPLWAVATGPATTSTTFDLGLDWSGKPFSYDLFAFDGNVMVDSATFNVDSGLSVTDPLSDPMASYQADVASSGGSPVPEPSTLFIVAGALFFGGIYNHRRLERKKMAKTA